MMKFLLGVLVGLALPLLFDLYLFGTIQPCDTTSTFEDGSSIQACHVKE